MTPKVKRELSADDDEEYLDELASDDEVDGDADPKKVMRGALRRPLYTQFNLKHLHDLIHFGNVDLDAPYQRDVVWTEGKMIGLIGSLFFNYYIPPVIFAVQLDPITGSETRMCIDGKQRCTSILMFMDGKIPFHSPATKEKFWYTLGGSQSSRNRKLLPEAMRKRFDQINLQCVEYEGISEEQQRDIFQRVQMGMPLSAAEKLQAIPGPWTAWVISLQKKYITEEGTLGTRLQWDLSRGRAFQGLTAAVMIAYGADRQPTYAKAAKFLERKDSPPAEFRKKMEMALSLCVNIATNYYDLSFGTVSQRLAPVEFHFVVYLIFSRMGHLSVESLARNIGMMRSRIRDRHLDIRANGRVMSDLHSIIQTIPRRTNPGEVAAAEEYEGDEVDPRDVRAAKRSRRAEAEDPTYHGDVVPRDIQASDAVNNTRSKTSKTSSTNRPAITRPPVPSVITAPRPGANTMDALPTPHTGNGYGQYPGQVNPYSSAYQAAGQGGPRPHPYGQTPQNPNPYAQQGQQQRQYQNSFGR